MQSMNDPYETPVFQRLRENRIVYLAGDITTVAADDTVSRLLALDAIDHAAEIKLYITSHGGSLYAALGIYDAMQVIEAPVATLCLGAAFGAAAWLLAAGAPGRRFATASSKILVHQGLAGVAGTTGDIRIAAQNAMKNEQLMVELLARHTGRSVEDVARAIERDLWLTPEQAVSFGIVDAVVGPSARKPALAPPCAATSQPRPEPRWQQRPPEATGFAQQPACGILPTAARTANEARPALPPRGDRP